MQGAQHRVIGRQARAGDAFADHAGVAQDWCTAFQRLASGSGKAGRKADMRRQLDHPGGMDHAHRDLFLVPVKPGQLRLGPDRGKGLGINRRTIGLVFIGHSQRLRSGQQVTGCQPAADRLIP